ncbi:MAG: hypothetical protein M1840_001414 [Geoglossum simile]|nr:MAG: hypothetical protein M1840_001414 [Geoglossum simile]
MATRTARPLDRDWTFKQADDKTSEYRPVAQFPTNVHLDLIANGLICDPFFAKNERDVQWIGEKTWIYRAHFPSPPTHSSNDAQKVVLAFEGLDTYATVALNGTEILKTDNMFIPERVEVTKLLCAEEHARNVLEITFESAFLLGKKIPEMYPGHHWGCWNGDPSRLAVRKAQYHYGWDWGPTLLTCGPWRPINIETYESRIADLYFTIDVDPSLKSATIIAKADVEGSAEVVKFDIFLKDKVVSTETAYVTQGTATATFLTRHPELWYPVGYGPQPLYTLTARLLAGNKVADTESKRFGIRRANLVQRKLTDAPGTTFFFEINNTPIFCGGSNWIPADSFTPRLSKEKYRDWVKLAVDGNQVMIRVWGGGIFEDQAFYDACDETGLLVWQDFLFGCGNYPAYPEFLASVKREATANVKLLRHHPSIVIYAGNNEDYQYQESECLDYDPKDRDPQSWLKTSFPARYIYEKLLVDVTKELVPGTYYHPGSPWGGKDTRDPTVGDIHQWNVWHGTQEKYQDFDKLAGRFVSEFGMQAFPNIETTDSYLPKGSTERYPQSSTVDFHNKATGHERRLALAIVDHYLRPKFAYYAIKRELAPFTIGINRTTTTVFPPDNKYSGIPLTTTHKIAIWATNLTTNPRTVNISTKAFNITSGAEIHHAIIGANTLLPANQSTEIAEFDVPVQKEKNPDNKDQDAHMKTVVVAYLHDSSTGTQLARYVNWPDPLKYVPLQQPQQLRFKIAPDAESVEVSAEVPLKGVALESAGGENDQPLVWADNCVDIVPGEAVALGVKGLAVGQESRVRARYLGL